VESARLVTLPTLHDLRRRLISKFSDSLPLSREIADWMIKFYQNATRCPFPEFRRKKSGHDLLAKPCPKRSICQSDDEGSDEAETLVWYLTRKNYQHDSSKPERWDWLICSSIKRCSFRDQSFDVLNKIFSAAIPLMWWWMSFRTPTFPNTWSPKRLGQAGIHQNICVGWRMMHHESFYAFRRTQNQNILNFEKGLSWPICG